LLTSCWFISEDLTDPVDSLRLLDFSFPERFHQGINLLDSLSRKGIFAGLFISDVSWSLSRVSSDGTEVLA
jgi:hypothetical protein